jgi:uncharacterized protein
VAAILLLTIASLAQAQSFPPLTGRVVDNAHLLDAGQVQTLTDRLAALEQNSGRQLVVATIPDLQGYPIEDYGYRLGRTWGLGAKDKNNGAILIVAPKERKVRVEVGYGLEGILTDALSSVIIRTQILPAFREGKMGDGIVAGTQAIIEQLSLPEDQARINAQQAATRPMHNESGSIAPLIVWLIIMGFVVVPLFRRRGFGRSGPAMLWGPGFGGGGGGWGGGGFGGGGGGGGFSGGGGSFGGGGASGGW